MPGELTFRLPRLDVGTLCGRRSISAREIDDDKAETE
jgi:hypothetical protein